MKRIKSKTTPRAPRGILVAGCALFPVLALAQAGGYYITPAVTVSAVHDDNVFFDPQNEQDDTFVRLSPSLETGFESEPFTWQAGYTFDAERYDEFDGLDSNQVRRFGNASVQYLPNSQLTLQANANYGKSQTGGDLNVLTGLQPGRQVAERFSVNPGLIYAFSGATTGSLDYLWSNDKLQGGVEADTYTTTADLEHAFSDENTVRLGYTYRSYEFDNPNGTGSSTYSHTPRLGWLHRFSPTLQLTVEGGPRISGDETDPYALIALTRELVRGQIELSYAIDETTLIGEAGRLETERVRFNFRHAFTADFEVGFTPTWSRIDRQGNEDDIFFVAANARYRVNNALFLVASYQHSDQEVVLPPVGNLDLSRNVFSLGFTLTYPRPGGETEL